MHNTQSHKGENLGTQWHCNCTSHGKGLHILGARALGALLCYCACSERIRDACGAIGEYFFAITQHYVDLLTRWDVGRIVVHDSSAVMALLRPDLFEGAMVRVDVETKGEITRGVFLLV